MNYSLVTAICKQQQYWSGVSHQYAQNRISEQSLKLHNIRTKVSETKYKEKKILVFTN